MIRPIGDDDSRAALGPGGRTEASAPSGMRVLCRLDDLPDGAAKGFPPPEGAWSGVFAVRQGDAVYVYVNSCPHIGTPLDWVPDRFLSNDGSHIVCATHGAEFRIVDGLCVRGPCRGEALEAVPSEIRDGIVLVPQTTGQ